MGNTTLKLALAAILVVLAAYAFWRAGGRRTDAPGDSTTVPSTTPPEYTAEPITLPANPDALPECLLMKTACKRDRCYFGNALNRHEERLCSQIANPALKNSCIDKVSSEDVIENTKIEGQVFNTANCGFYANLSVELWDETGHAIAGSTNTNNIGEYSFDADAGGDYTVSVRIDGMRLNQTIRNTAKRTYIVDYALS